MLLQALETVEDIQPIIDHIVATDTAAWQMGVVRSLDGNRNCFFGHLWQWAKLNTPPGASSDLWASAVWEAFEERWCTTYRIYPVNDGQNPGYQQTEPRDRVVAFLEALRDGQEPATRESMEADLRSHLR